MTDLPWSQGFTGHWEAPVDEGSSPVKLSLTSEEAVEVSSALAVAAEGYAIDISRDTGEHVTEVEAWKRWRHICLEASRKVDAAIMVSRMQDEATAERIEGST